MKTIIFDLDGTLVDTSRDLIYAVNTCLTNFGYAPALTEHDRPVAFQGGRAMLMLAMQRLGINAHHATDWVNNHMHHFLAVYQNNIDTHSAFYPCAIETITMLKKHRYKVGICTNKPVALAEQLIKALGQRNVFDSLVGAGTLPVAKPDPAPYRLAVEQAGGSLDASCLVGDTLTDARTARAAGVAYVHVDFGGLGGLQDTPENDTTIEAHATITSYMDLPHTVLRVLA